MSELITFFVILIAGLVFSEIFRRLHLPYVTALILSGIAIGPFVLNVITLNETISFFGSIGVIFLMFIAGTEIKLDAFKHTKKKILVIALFCGLIPFIVGFGIGMIFNYVFFTNLILGIMFISSSVAVIIPSLEASGYVNTEVGKTILTSTIFLDIISLILLSFVLQVTKPETLIPIYLYIPFLLGFVVVLKILMTRFYKYFHKGKKGKDLFESETRFVLVSLIASVILFEVIGVHSIIAGFITGIILADSIKSKLAEKIRTISYGFFIPTFFIIIGAEMNVLAFLNLDSIRLSLVIVGGLIISKFIGGFIGGRLIRYNRLQSLVIGASAIPQLTTTLATAFAAKELNLLDDGIINALILLAIITTLVSPLLIRFLAKKDNRLDKK